jgi:4'-phosphopantetheinyl transferase
VDSLNLSWHPAPARVGLSADEVHVWCAALRRTATDVEGLARLLSAEERERAGRFRSDSARTEFVVARGMLRAILARYLARAADRIALGHTNQGKPKLACRSLHFNVSHSHGLALFAVTGRGEVGVDVERLRPYDNHLSLADRYFAPREAALLRGLAPECRLEAFFHAWTRKEAVVKASGAGLSYGLERIEVTFLPGEPARVLRLDDEDHLAAGWSLRALAPAPGYVGAVALQGHEYRLVCWRWVD